MIETPFFFPGACGALFGILHEPAPAAARREPFVFCHAFAEEKLWAHRVFVSYARRLAARGHTVLRFDYGGNGDSEGDFSGVTLGTWLEDVRCAVAEVRRRTGQHQVGLLGLRFGAAVAALTAECVPAIQPLILWAPVVNGSRYMQELLRTNLTTQMAAYKEIRRDREALVASLKQGETVNIDGYELTDRLYTEASAVSLLGARSYQERCLVVQVDRPGAKPIAELQQLAAAYPAGSFVMAHEEPFWKEILRFYDEAPQLFEATNSWMDAAHASAGH